MSSKLIVSFKEIVGGDTKYYSWGENGSDLEISFDDLRNLIEQNRKLKDSVAVLTGMPKDMIVGDPKVQEEISSAALAMRSIDPHIESLWNRIPLQQMPILSDNNKAQKVFDVPELLELIVLELPARDKLKAQGVSKTWLNGIKASKIIQQALGLKPAINYFSPFDCGGDTHQNPNAVPGFRYKSVDELKPWDGTNWSYKARTVNNDQHIEISVDRKTKVKLGATCQSMLLCQPPLKKAYLYATYYDDRAAWNAPRQELCASMIKSDTGITVGEMLDAAAKLEAVAVDEAKERSAALGTNIERWYICLQGTVKLNDKDPEMNRRRNMVVKEAKAFAAKKLKEEAERAQRAEMRKAREKGQGMNRHLDENFNDNASDSDDDGHYLI